MKRSLVVASVWTLCIGGSALVACGGDDNDFLETSGLDAGGDATSPNVDATAPAPDGGDAGDAGDASVHDGAVGSDDDAGDSGGDAGDSGVIVIGLDAGAASATVYAGKSATLSASDVSGEPAVTYAWTVTSAPPGSAVTTASIASPTAATVQLPTDKAGTYVVNVTASGEGVSGQSTVTITAVAAHVVYGIDIAANATGTDAGAALGVVDTDGTGGHPIVCVVPGSGAASTAAVEAVDTYEGAPGTPTKVVFGSPEVDDAGTLYAQLYLTDTSSGCPAGATAGIGATSIFGASAPAGTGGSPPPNALYLLHPRFSPDGTKVAFTTAHFSLSFPVPVGDTTSTVNVVGIDGSNPTSLGTIIDGDAGANGEPASSTFLGGHRQPEWKDATHVGWARAETTDAGVSAWNLVTSTVPPAAGDPQVYMSCTSPTNVVPERLVFLADGTVLTAYTPPTGVADLVVLAPDPTTKACTVVRNLTNLPATGSGVEAFALSPDGTTAAFTVTTSMLTGPAVYTVPLDGSSAPRGVTIALPTDAGADSGAGDAGAGVATESTIGLRWVGGGGQLAFTTPVTTDAGTTIQTIGTAVFLNGGSAVSSVLVADSGITVTAVGSGDATSCSFGGKKPLGDGLFAGALAFVALVRRRVRRKRKGAPSSM